MACQRCLTAKQPDYLFAGYELKHAPSQAHVLSGLSTAATSPDAILDLLSDIGFPLWTLMSSPGLGDDLTDALVCFAFTVSDEGACLMAALSLHGLLPCDFPREAWNGAVGSWFKLGGTQRSAVPHRLFHFRAGQVALPLSIPVTSGHGLRRGFTREGCEVEVMVDEHQVSLNGIQKSDVWLALFQDSCLPFIEIRKQLRVECTGLGWLRTWVSHSWDVLVRTGRHDEEVYGPSLARLELAGAFNEADV